MNSYRTTHKDRVKRASHEAAEWLQIMRQGASPGEHKAFMAWVHASPLHLRELLMASMLERDLSASGVLEGFDVEAIIRRAREKDNVVPLGDGTTLPERHGTEATREVRPRRRRRFPVWARAAVLAGLVLLGVAGIRSTLPVSQPAEQYVTSLGEKRVLTLDDGSVVTMAPRSRISIDFSSSERDVRLQSGEADFQVAHDRSRPFRVHAGANTVQAVGTRFSVNRLPSGTVVKVTEGTVKVTVDHLSALDDGINTWIRSWLPPRLDAIRRPGADASTLDGPRSLTAGESAHITRNGRGVVLGRIDAGQQMASRHGQRLVFHDDTLADIAAEFNRYNGVRMAVEGDAARMQRYSGVFNADDAASFIEFLACCSRLEVRREEDRIVIRMPPGPSLGRR